VRIYLVVTRRCSLVLSFGVGAWFEFRALETVLMPRVRLTSYAFAWMLGFWPYVGPGGFHYIFVPI